MAYLLIRAFNRLGQSLSGARTLRPRVCRRMEIQARER